MKKTIKISRKNIGMVNVEWKAPGSVDDPRWAELNMDSDDINAAAIRSTVIDIQRGAREFLPDEKKIREYVDGWKRGMRTTRTVPTLSADVITAGGFTPEQLRMLAETGMKVEV